MCEDLLLDLNLLRVLASVIEQRTLTAASEYLEVSQPSISQSLQRLRKATNTELFIRKGRELEPTRDALDLYAETSHLLDGIESAVSNIGDFSPSASDRTYRIALTDVGEQVLLPSIVTALRAYAPQSKLEVVPLDTTSVVRQLLLGKLDLAISSSRIDLELTSQTIRIDRYICITAQGLFASPGPSIETLRDYPRIVMPASTGHTLVEGLLDEPPAGSIVITNFSAIPALVTSSDLIAFTPEALVNQWQKAWSIDAWPIQGLDEKTEVLVHTAPNQLSQASTWFARLVTAELSNLYRSAAGSLENDV